MYFKCNCKLFWLRFINAIFDCAVTDTEWMMGGVEPIFVRLTIGKLSAIRSPLLCAISCDFKWALTRTSAQDLFGPSSRPIISLSLVNRTWMSGEVPQMQLFFPGSRAVHYWPHLSDKNCYYWLVFWWRRGWICFTGEYQSPPLPSPGDLERARRREERWRFVPAISVR